jgi:hypothetical protein
LERYTGQVQALLRRMWRHRQCGSRERLLPASA